MRAPSTTGGPAITKDQTTTAGQLHALADLLPPGTEIAGGVLLPIVEAARPQIERRLADIEKQVKALLDETARLNALLQLDVQ